MYRDVYRDMSRDMSKTHMCVDLLIGRSIEVCKDMRVDTFVDMCINRCADISMDICEDMRMDVCIDMRTDMSTQIIKYVVIPMLIYTSVHMPTYVSIHMPTCVSIHMSKHTPIRTSVRTYTHIHQLRGLERRAWVLEDKISLRRRRLDSQCLPKDLRRPWRWINELTVTTPRPLGYCGLTVTIWIMTPWILPTC